MFFKAFFYFSSYFKWQFWNQNKPLEIWMESQNDYVFGSKASAKFLCAFFLFLLEEFVILTKFYWKGLMSRRPRYLMVYYVLNQFENTLGYSFVEKKNHISFCNQCWCFVILPCICGLSKTAKNVFRLPGTCQFQLWNYLEKQFF